MRIKTLILLLPFALACLWGRPGPVTGSPGKSVRIDANESAVVEGARICLGDVARIGANPVLKELLETLVLSKSPKPGRIKVLNRHQVMARLRSLKALPQGVVISIPDRIYVKREGWPLAPEMVRESVLSFLSEKFGSKEIELSGLTLPGSGLIPRGVVELSVVPGQKGVDKSGNLVLYLDLFVDGKKQERIRVSGKIALYEDVVCAGTALARGRTLTAQDLVLMKKNIYGVSGGSRGELARSLENVAGRALTAAVDEHEPVLLNRLKKIPLVRRGDQVRLMAQKENLLIVASGICRQDGGRNDLIRIENVKSGRIIRGIVREKDMVEVVY